jgi:hypothetical protein
LTTKVCAPWASDEYVTGLEHAVAAAPSREHVTAVALAALNANVAVVEDVVDDGPDWIATVGGGVTVHANESDADRAPADAVTANVCGPTASDEYVTGLAHAVGAAPSSEHATAVAFAALNAKVAAVALLEGAGPDWIFTVGGAVTVHENESDAESEPDDALTANVCWPAARPEYVTGLEHAEAAAPSSEQETADAFTAEKPKVAVVELVDAPGVDVIVTVGCVGGGGGGGGRGGATGETVQVARAWAEPALFTTRTASVWLAAESPVSVSGDEHANAGGVLSRAHVVDVAPCDVQLIVADVEDVGEAGCDVIETVGTAVDARARVACLRATWVAGWACAPAFAAVIATAAGLTTSAANRARRRVMRCGMGNQLRVSGRFQRERCGAGSTKSRPAMWSSARELVLRPMRLRAGS